MGYGWQAGWSAWQHHWGVLPASSDTTDQMSGRFGEWYGGPKPSPEACRKRADWGGGRSIHVDTLFFLVWLDETGNGLDDGEMDPEA